MQSWLLSVCLSVCPSVCPLPVPKSRTKGQMKLKIGRNEAGWPVASFRDRMSKVNVTNMSVSRFKTLLKQHLLVCSRKD